MKKLQTYKVFNESLRYKIKGKSDDVVLKEFDKLESMEQLEKSIKWNNLNLLKYSIKNNNYHHNTLSRYLSYAINFGDYDMVKYMIDRGVDVNYDGDEPLKWATEDGVYDVVKLLIDNGANIHVEDEKPLKTACKSGNYDLVKLFLEKGADPLIDIFEPLTIARENDHIEIQKLLIKYIDKKIHGKKVYESLKDKIKGKSDEEIIIDYLKNRGYDIDDRFSIAIMTSEFNSISKKLLKTIEVEDLEDTDTIFTKNIVGTIPELVHVFRSADLIHNIKNILISLI